MTDVGATLPGSLSEEKARADALFSSIGDGIIATNDQGHIERVNQVALDLLGFQERDLIGVWYPQALVQLNERNQPIPVFERPLTQAILNGVAVTGRGYYQRKDGSILPVSVTASPIILRKKPVGAVEIFRDISALIENEAMKDDFISAASHQLRTPLNTIGIYSRMLLGGYVDELTPAQLKLVKTILTSAEKMSELTDKLLSISRLEAGKITVSAVTINLASLVRDILKDSEPLAESKKLTIVSDLDKKLTRVTDPVLLKEAYGNVIHNALKYCSPESEVHITLHQARGHTLLKVVNHGPGVSRSEQARIFSKFYRGDNAVRMDTHGSGLGLYFAEKIMMYLNGKIWFRSTPNKTTTFYISL